jgi:hypothetical protein
LFAGPVLGGATPGLVVLTLGIELYAGSDTDVIGYVRCADGISQCFGVSRTRALIGVGGREHRLERIDMQGVQADAGKGLRVPIGSVSDQWRELARLSIRSRLGLQLPIVLRDRSGQFFVHRVAEDRHDRPRTHQDSDLADVAVDVVCDL